MNETLTQPPEDDQDVRYTNDPSQESFEDIIRRNYGHDDRLPESIAAKGNLQQQEDDFGKDWQRGKDKGLEDQESYWQVTDPNSNNRASAIPPRGGRGVAALLRNYRRRIIIGASIGSLLTGLVGMLGTPSAMVGAVKELATRYGDRFGVSSNFNKMTHVKKRFYIIDPNCDGSRAACKLSNGISQKEVDKFKKAGVLLDEDVVREHGKIRVKAFTANRGGVTIKVTMENFDTHYQNNAAFRGGIDRVNNPRAFWWRSAASLFNYSKYKMNRKNPMGDSNDPKKIEAEYRKNSQGQVDDDTGTKERLAQENPEENRLAQEEAGADDTSRQNDTLPDTDDMDNIPESSASDTAKKVTGAGLKGAVFGILSGVDSACTMNKYLRNLVVGAKILAAAQLIRYAGVFLTVADMLRSGDGSYAQIAYLAGLMITPSTLSASKGKTFFNSGGWALMSQGKVTDKLGMARFTTGTPGLRYLVKFREIINTAFSSVGLTPTVCKHEQRWYGQLAFAIAGLGLSVLSGGSFSAAGVAISVAAGVTISVVAQYSAPLIIKYLAGTLAPGAKDKGGGYSMGNAFAAGVGALSLSRHGKTHGLPPATKSSYAKAAYEADQNYTKYLAGQNYGKNPFSSDDPNSVLNRIRLAVAPYVLAPFSSANVQQVASTLLNPLQLVANSGGSLLNNRVMAATDTYGGEQCADEQYSKAPGGGLQTDAYCNVIHITAEHMPYEKVEGHLRALNHIDEAGNIISEDYKDFKDICIDKDYPYSSEESDGETPDTRRCAIDTPQSIEDYYRQFIDYTDGIDAINKNAEGKLGQNEAQQAPSSGVDGPFDIEKCKALTNQGEKAACNATAFDDYRYLWGGGHGSLSSLKSTIEKVVAGQDKFSDTVDCSGLIRAAYYMTYGKDIGGGTANSMAHGPHFKPIAKEDAKPGDIVWHSSPSDHIGIIMQNNPSQKTWKIFNASSSSKPKERQIEARTASYSEFQTFTYTGQ